MAFTGSLCSRSSTARQGIFGQEDAAAAAATEEVHTASTDIVYAASTEEGAAAAAAASIAAEEEEADISVFINNTDDGFLPRRVVSDNAIKQHRALLEDHTKICEGFDLTDIQS
ncbi:MAG: hypothetical protein ACKPKO_56850, partial [Candidatus Fonsibacter sp.]